MLALFPDRPASRTACSQLGGLAATELAERFGTPLVVYCEAALRERARDVPARRARRARRLRDEGVPERRPAAPARRGGPRRRRLDARRARVRAARGDRGRPTRRARQQQVGRGAARARPRRARSSCSTRSTSRRAAAGRRPARARPRHARRRGARRTRRSAPGTTARSSASTPDEALEAIARRATAGLEVEGLHVHVGSQLADGARAPGGRLAARGVRRALPRRARLDAGARRRRRRLRHPPRRGRAGAAGRGARALARGRGRRASGRRASLPAPRLVLEPGRSLVGPRRVHALPRRRRQAGGRHGATSPIDGGMSDNPRPQLYGARYTALLANRADEEPADGPFTIAGQALRVGRRADRARRAARAAARRPARGSGDRRATRSR